MKARLSEVLRSFPLRLFLLHFREHFILVLVWILLALMLDGRLFALFGIRLLLLLPEYQGQTSPLSYFITGSAFGALLMAWNLVTYLLYARRFPFLATLARPFTLFSLNNAVAPLAVLIYYLVQCMLLQHSEAGYSPAVIAVHLAAFLAGAVGLLLLLFFYLAFTNTDVRRLPGFAERGMERRARQEARAGAANWGVETYISTRGHVRRVRATRHYHMEMVQMIYRQNHLNTLLLQLVSLVLLILLGQAAEWSFFRFPAGASLLVLLAILLALIGGISYWFGPWRFMVFLALLLFIEGGSARLGQLEPPPALGLDYQRPYSPVYQQSTLEALTESAAMDQDRKAMEEVLDRWRSGQTDEKPVLVILTASGGGLKAARWTMQVLQQLEAALPAPLLPKVALMTGASGGVFALAYQRELWRLDQKDGGTRRTDTLYRDRLSMDLLNSVAFSLVSSDLFHTRSRLRMDGNTYLKDRGYHFERQFHENTGYLLDKRLEEYRMPESEASIPMLIISPTIINDGRRLLIGGQGVRHLCRPDRSSAAVSSYATDGVDFRAFFKDRGADRLHMASALRMNATFPYVLPVVGLPSEPIMRIMDTGMRDNFGISLALRFVQQHQQWIRDHTRGVLLLQIRCWEKDPPVESADHRGLIGETFRPFGLLGEQSRFQDFDQDAASSLIGDMLGPERLQVVRFIYEPGPDQSPASLSLHLTRREKMDIVQAWYRPRNQAALELVRTILSGH
jgi:hypothetical protein